MTLKKKYAKKHCAHLAIYLFYVSFHPLLYPAVWKMSIFKMANTCFVLFLYLLSAHRETIWNNQTELQIKRNKRMTKIKSMNKQWTEHTSKWMHCIELIEMLMNWKISNRLRNNKKYTKRNCARSIDSSVIAKFIGHFEMSSTIKVFWC